MDEKKRSKIKQSKLRLVKPLDEGTFEEKLRKHRLSFLYRALLVIVICIALVLMIYILYRNKKYTDYDVVRHVDNITVAGTESIPIGNSILEFSKDGARCMDGEGNVIWNQTYEMQNPIVSVCGEVAAIADYNGRTIYIQSKEKQLGTVTTNLPIRSINVAANGVVAVVLEDTQTTWINIYDPKGNELVKFHTTMKNTGYPASVCLSPDALLCAVSYIYVDEGVIKSRVAFYNFDEYGKNQTDNLVGGYDYTDTVIPYVKFMNNSVAFAVGDESLMFYNGSQKPELGSVYYFASRIRSVFHNENYVGLVFENRSGENKYCLEIYNKSGNLVRKRDFNMEYTDIVFYGDNYIIYNEENCLIYTMDGRLKYDGAFKESVKMMLPSQTKFRYTIITDDSLETIQLK